MALGKNIKHNRILHSRTVLLHFRAEDVPRIPSLEKVQTEKLGGGFHRIVARYGFMEDLQLESVLFLAREQGLDLNPETTSFYIGRESLVYTEAPSMARRRTALFCLSVSQCGRCHLVFQSSRRSGHSSRRSAGNLTLNGPDGFNSVKSIKTKEKGLTIIPTFIHCMPVSYYRTG